MSNLKKLLCAVLALAMVASFVIIPAASAAEPTKVSDFTDAADIAEANKEAVDVLTAIGMLQGVSDDAGGYKFQPKGTFTRAQAAKIMAYYMLGKTGAELLPVPTEAPFLDVPVGAWEAKFVAYCKNQGVINGVGYDMFDPAGSISSVAMIKMLLAATGYGARGEFVGESWALNTIQIANARSLITAADGATDLTSSATRETIVRYVFRSLTEMSLVTYNTLFGDYVDVGNTMWTTDTNKVTQAQIMYNLSKFSQNQENAYGVPGHKWRQNNRDLNGNVYTDGTIIAEFVTAGTTQGDLYSKYQWNLNSQDNYFGNGISTKISVNGLVLDLDNDYVKTHLAVRNGMNAAFANYGARVILYDMDKNNTVDFIVQKDEVLAEVTDVSMFGTTATVFTRTGASVDAEKTGVSVPSATGLAVGDKLWVTPKLYGYTEHTNGTYLNAATYDNWLSATGGMTIIEWGKVTVEEGQIARSNRNQYASYGQLSSLTTTSGKVYNVPSSLFFNNATVNAGDFDVDTVFYIGKSGYLLGYEAKGSSHPADLSYLLLTDLDLRSFNGGSGNSGSVDLAKALIFNTDGTYKWVDLKVNAQRQVTGLPKYGGVYVSLKDNAQITNRYNDTYTYNTFVNDFTTNIGQWYSYSIDSNGAYTLYPADTAYCKTGVNLQLHLGTSGINSYVTANGVTNYVDNATKFTLTKAGSAINRTGNKNFLLPVKDAGGNYTYTRATNTSNGFNTMTISSAVNGTQLIAIYVIDFTGTGTGSAIKYAFVSGSTGNSGADWEDYYTYYYDGTKYVSNTTKTFSVKGIAANSIVVLDEENNDASVATLNKVTGVVTAASSAGNPGWVVVTSTKGQFMLNFSVDNESLIANVTNIFSTVYYTGADASILKVGNKLDFYIEEAINDLPDTYTGSGVKTATPIAIVVTETKADVPSTTPVVYATYTASMVKMAGGAAYAGDGTLDNIVSFLGAGSYEPGIDAKLVGMKAGSRVFGMFNSTTYAKIDAPPSITGYTEVYSYDDMTVGTYYIFESAGGYSYLVIMLNTADEPAPPEEPEEPEADAVAEFITGQSLTMYGSAAGYNGEEIAGYIDPGATGYFTELIGALADLQTGAKVYALFDGSFAAIAIPGEGFDGYTLADSIAEMTEGTYFIVNTGVGVFPLDYLVFIPAAAAE